MAYGYLHAMTPIPPSAAFSGKGPCDPSMKPGHPAWPGEISGLPKLREGLQADLGVALDMC